MTCPACHFLCHSRVNIDLGMGCPQINVVNLLRADEMDIIPYISARVKHKIQQNQDAGQYHNAPCCPCSLFKIVHR